MVARLISVRSTIANGILLVAEWGAAALFAVCLALGILVDGMWFVPALIGLAGGVLARSASRSHGRDIAAGGAP